MELKNNLTIITLNSPNLTDFASERNRELAKAKTPWVLFIDSDEKITKDLKAEIIQAISSNVYDAYYLRRSDHFLGKTLKYGETGSAKFIRLAKKDFGQWVRPVHEVWEPHDKTRAEIGELVSPILHYPHLSLASFLDKINTYSTIEAKFRHSQGKKSSIFHILIYPLAKFFYNYLLRLGLLDGTPGFIMAAMMSFHSYLTWTKLYLLWHKK